MATVEETLAPRRWVAVVVALPPALLVLVWTLVLAYRLPARHTTDHWDLAWVGFDVALGAALAATAWGVAQRATWAPSVAAVAATLLLCDAWFDNVLASGMEERFEAAGEAALVEVPLALFCVVLALRPERTTAAVLAAFGRLRPGRRR
jgi:uncharacterized membrane protein